MSLRRIRVNVERERVLYLDAIRRACAEGRAGRRALDDAHEAFALAMVAAGRPELATDAVSALLASRPRCEATWSLAARVAGASGEAVAVATRKAARRHLARATG